MASDEAETSDLEARFEKASDHLRCLVPRLDSGQLLGFYALYKQATVGPCNAQRPTWYQMEAKHKWEAWNNLGNMSREVAMVNYVRAIEKLDPDWLDNAADTKNKIWVSVSKPCNVDQELCDGDKTLFDWIKDGDETKVWELLTKEPSHIGILDDTGMLPIHWAADRGHLPIIKQLVEAGSDVNSRDMDGQTPLHYAVSCGHFEATEYLLSVGAQSLKDNNGMVPKDIADEHLVAIL